MNLYSRVGWSLLGVSMLVLGMATSAQQPAPGRGGRGGDGGQQAAPAGPQLLHPLFQDHAVLQRDQPIRVYGAAAPSTVVAVTLGTSRAQGRAGADGRWAATLPAMAAGGPYTLSASANGETSAATDVLIGDVYFCSGQSNMGFTQRQAASAAADAKNARDGQIRQFTVPAVASLTPQSRFSTATPWVVGSPDTVGGFSAACYYFVRELKEKAKVDVPMGLVVAAYGGARLRTLMSEEGLRKLGLENGDLDILGLYRREQAAGIQRWGARWEAWLNAGHAADGKPWMPDYNDASWKVAPPALGPWALWDGGTNPDGFIGQMWMRTTVTLTAAQAVTAGAELDLGSINQEDETWLNGRYLGASSFANRTRYAIPAGLLKAGVNVIATNIYCGWRDCGLRGAAETRAVRLGDSTAVPLSNPWKARQMADGVVGPQLPWGSVHGMALHYNAMIRPVGPYNFRGGVWYQGESDVHFGTDYYVAALGALMAEWRQAFNAPDLPILVVQLPGYGPVPSRPTASTWANLREAQRRAVKADRHAALAVTVDIGNETDLHPTNKREVGRRLALAAHHLIYGAARGPSGAIVASVTRRGADVVVAFRDVTGDLWTRSETPSGFELCGQTCRWAEARVEKTTVVLPNAGDATRVRYGWGPTPVSPLYDDGELPAGPFEEPIR